MKKTKEQQAASRVACMATYNNPVSIMLLGKVSKFAAERLAEGMAEQDAVASTADYIRQLNGEKEAA